MQHRYCVRWCKSTHKKRVPPCVVESAFLKVFDLLEDRNCALSYADAMSLACMEIMYTVMGVLR